MSKKRSMIHIFIVHLQVISSMLEFIMILNCVTQSNQRIFLSGTQAVPSPPCSVKVGENVREKLCSIYNKHGYSDHFS